MRSVLRSKSDPGERVAIVVAMEAKLWWLLRDVHQLGLVHSDGHLIALVHFASTRQISSAAIANDVRHRHISMRELAIEFMGHNLP